jgi:hypothetical protein
MRALHQRNLEVKSFSTEFARKGRPVPKRLDVRQCQETVVFCALSRRHE